VKVNLGCIRVKNDTDTLYGTLRLLNVNYKGLSTIGR
jgi:hypothetical protein